MRYLLNIQVEISSRLLTIEELREEVWLRLLKVTTKQMTFKARKLEITKGNM